MTQTQSDAPTVSLNINVSVQLLRDLLCSAVEGGSNYWARFSQAQVTQDTHDYVSVYIQETEEPRRGRIVTAEDLGHGLVALAACAADDNCDWQTAAAQHFADALSNHDATTADVVLQMMVFGKLIYG